MANLNECLNSYITKKLFESAFAEHAYYTKTLAELKNAIKSQNMDDPKIQKIILDYGNGDVDAAISALEDWIYDAECGMRHECEESLDEVQS